MSSLTQSALWKEVIHQMQQWPHTSAPRGQDAGRVRWLLFENYLLGERPTRAEMAAVAGEHGWGREVTALWAERLRDPFRKPRARYGWVYPFVIPNGIVQKLGMEPLHTRLSRTLCDAATAYSEAVASNRPIDKLEKALCLQTSDNPGGLSPPSAASRDVIVIQEGPDLLVRPV
jgi:hypothetical protein